MDIDLVVIGGGPAGMAAACSAMESGVQSLLIIERDMALGGILNQCIHNGFGLHYFKEELTGPEYAERFIQKVREKNIPYWTQTMVLQITADKEIHAVNPHGYHIIKAKSIILAMGCRERTRGAIGIAGTRPSGILTAGAAQRYINIEGQMPGKRIVILGSGDIGLIMARRLTLKGAKVLAVVELLPYSNGLNRNIVQCLEDYHIPLLLSHTVTFIHGQNRVEGVTLCQVDENRRPIIETAQYWPCDTLLLSVGLIPENELSKQAEVVIDPKTRGPMVNQRMETSVPGIFACGNVAQVHDLVDFVSLEGENAGKGAAAYLSHTAAFLTILSVLNGKGLSYILPQKINLPIETPLSLFFRVNAILPFARIVVKQNDRIIATFRREDLYPSEMQKITLPLALLKNLTEDSLLVEALEV